MQIVSIAIFENWGFLPATFLPYEIPQRLVAEIPLGQNLVIMSRVKSYREEQKGLHRQSFENYDGGFG